MTTHVNLTRWLIWMGFAATLIIAPLVFHSGASLSLLSQMGTMMILGLSYNMLLGQGGMLSFGHAVYSGLAAFCAIHAMNYVGNGEIWMPITLIPLIGGVAGMCFGIVFGYVTTRKSGTTFSMITLGIVELVFACSLMLPGFFGGEGGVSTNRVTGKPFFGLSYGPQIQVVYLIAFWLFVSTVGMFAFTQTPLSRMINAVRDNPDRAEFIGYDAQKVRYLTLVISAFFAGIAGGLSAINFEMASAENVSAIRSGAILIFTFLGGIGYFFGPMVGAVIGVFLTVMLSGITKAWQLYLGVFFIIIVMYAPSGVAGLMMQNFRVMKYGKFSRIATCLAVVSIATSIASLGIIIGVEMLYHLSLESGNGSEMNLFGWTIDTMKSTGWIVAGVLLATGAIAFTYSRRPFQYAWRTVNAEIDDLIHKGNA